MTDTWAQGSVDPIGRPRIILQVAGHQLNARIDFTRNYALYVNRSVFDALKLFRWPRFRVVDDGDTTRLDLERIRNGVFVGEAYLTILGVEELHHVAVAPRDLVEAEDHCTAIIGRDFFVDTHLKVNFLSGYVIVEHRDD